MNPFIWGIFEASLGPELLGQVPLDLLGARGNGRRAHELPDCGCVKFCSHNMARIRKHHMCLRLAEMVLVPDWFVFDGTVPDGIQQPVLQVAGYEFQSEGTVVSIVVW